MWVQFDAILLNLIHINCWLNTFILSSIMSWLTTNQSRVRWHHYQSSRGWCEHIDWLLHLMNCAWSLSTSWKVFWRSLLNLIVKSCTLSGVSLIYFWPFCVGVTPVCSLCTEWCKDIALVQRNSNTYLCGFVPLIISVWLMPTCFSLILWCVYV